VSGPAAPVAAAPGDRRWILVVTAAIAVTFADALLGRGVFFQRDILSYWYPGMAAFRRAVGDGAWPLWNPSLGFGAPLLADASLEIAYPPTWLALVLPLHVYYKLFVVGHCVWAALGARLLAARLGLSPAAAAAAGGAFALSGPLLSAASLFHHYAGASWMPWVLAAVVALARRPGGPSALALGLAGGGQLLAGSGDLCLATGVAAAAGLGWHLVRTRPAGAPLVHLARSGLLAAAPAGALGAVQWLPTAGQAASAARTARVGEATYWSLHPASLADLAVPRLLAGLPLEPRARREVFEGRGPLLDCLYLGIPTLAMASLALLAGGAAPRAAGALALFFLLAGLGRHTPLYAILDAVPGFSLMRYPQKHLLAASLGVALVAAFGLHVWLSPAGLRVRGRAWRLGGLLVLAGGLAVAAALWLLSGRSPVEGLAAGGPGTAAAATRVARSAALLALTGMLVAWRGRRERPPRAATALLLLAWSTDLVAVGRTVNPLAPPDLVAARPDLVDELLPFAGATRVQFVARDPGCTDRVGGPAGWPASARAALASVEVLRPPTGVRWGLLGSFDGEFTGLEPRWAGPVMAAASNLADTAAGLRLQRVGNVGHVLFLGHPRAGGPAVERRLPTSYACALELLRVEDPLPRAYVVAGERPAGADGVAALLDPEFDPRGEVLLGDGGPARPGGRPGAARVVSRTADAVEVEATLSAPGVLVLVEAFDPGWRVSVDGRPAPVVRANVLFRGVRLAPGRHVVRFAYRPRAAALGLGLTLAGLALALAWGATRAGLKLPGRGGSIQAREERA
jgi:Bacterial membrane protein YfhO